MTSHVRRSLLLVSLLIAVVSSASAEIIKDYAGWYLVDIPLPTATQDQFQDTEIGKLRMFIRSHESGKTSYSIAYMDFPDGSFAGKDLASIYSEEIRAQVKSSHGSLRSTAPCKLGDFDGREAIMDDPSDHTVLRMRIFILGDRLMEIVYTGNNGTENSAEVAKFLDSFRLLHAPKSHIAH